MSETPSLYIFYGSATGNAEQIAKDLAAHSNAKGAGFSSVLCEPLEKYKKYSEKWLQPLPEHQKHGIVVVTSTTGNGDAPENASRFVRYLKRKTTVDSQPFQHCAFAVLGLGDTNYDNFCATGKVVDQKMQQSGGTRAKPLGMADEATGLEDVVEPWTATVVEDVAKACFSGSQSGDETAALASSSLPSNNADTNNATKVPDQTEAPKPAVAAEAPAVAPTATTTPSPTATITPAQSSTPLFILYGSATGNAEHIAKELASTYQTILQNPDAKCFFPAVVCCEMDQYKKQCAAKWEQVPVGDAKHGIIIITSTTGNGDAPENASRFVRYLKRKSTIDQQPFQHCVFAVLGLGDTNYDQFCETGRIVDKKMAELGGTRAKKLGMADEATGLEDVVEPWTSSVLSDITNACRGKSGGSGVSNAVTVKSAAKAVPSRTASDSSRAEEKKMENDAVAQVPAEAVPPVSSVGVATVRSLLSLDASTPLPEVNDNTLPSLGTSLSSCELVQDEDVEGRRRSRGMSLAEMDRMTISSGSTATLHYTMNKPHETSIMNASYLTKTSTEAAAAVAKLLSDKTLDDKLLMQAMQIYEKDFLLSGPMGGTDMDKDAVTYECNGKRVIEMTMSLPDDFTLEYQPGDSLGIIVPNTPPAVQFILNMLETKHNVKPTQKISIDSNRPVTVEEAVRTYIDLCSPLKNKRILHSLSQFTTNSEESNVLRLLASKTPQGEELFKKLVDEQRMTVVDILKAFPSCQSIPLEGLIGILPGIPPRYYSVSSSPLDPHNGALALTVAFSVVDYLTPSLLMNGNEVGRRRIGGVATRFLEVICSGFLSGTTDFAPSTLKIFPKPTAEFQLPPSLSTPLILIGPGTGVAPFVGFLRHRRAQAMESKQAATSVVEGTWRGDYEMEADDLPVSKIDAPGDVMQQRNLGKIELFFGCRRADHDWLFQEEMEQLKKEGIITDLYTAFSRQKPKTYVQDIMVHDEVCRASLVDLLLKNNAAVYICGDGNQMAKDVQNALAEVIAPHVEDAPAYLEKMKKQRRLLMDIWTS